MGRFIQQDPHPGKLNRPDTVVNNYIYALNSPNRYIDPSGRIPIVLIVLFIASLNGLYQGKKNADEAKNAGFDSGKQNSVFWSGFFSSFLSTVASAYLPGGAVLWGAVGASINILATQQQLTGKTNVGEALAIGFTVSIINFAIERFAPGAIGAAFNTSIYGSSILSGPTSIGIGHIVTSPLGSGVPEHGCVDSDGCLATNGSGGKKN